MSIEHLLARLTPQSTGTDPRMPGGGKPELTAADISLIASHAPHMSFHALMTKYCHDRISLQKLYVWLHNTSLTEWFLNPVNENVSIHVGQVNRLVDLAIIGWYDPAAQEAATLPSRASYIKANHETFKRKYQTHFNYLTGELDLYEAIGRRAIKGFIRRDGDDEA